MRDYAELVKRLREAARFSESRGYSGMANTTEEAADAIEELQAELVTMRNQLPKWISVEERLPEDKETCLIWYEYYHYSLERVLPEYGIGFYLSMYDMWYGDPSTGKDVKVLYWMPLPKPPKEDT